MLSTVCVRVEEELQNVSVTVEEYHRDLCLTSLLQDPGSSQWTSHSVFFEASHAVFLLYTLTYKQTNKQTNNINKFE